MPGDRASDCRALMAPVQLHQTGAKGFQLVHRCLGCGALRRNRVATDTVVPDDLDQLIALMPTDPPPL